jgi:hypothetical protein
MLPHPDSVFIEENVDLLDPGHYAACKEPFGAATMLPRQSYVSETFQRLENEKIWTREWICIGTTADIPHAGDLLPYTIGQHGIHVQRKSDDGLIGRFNKAQHGGCRAVPAQCRTGKKTKCSYTSCGFSRDRGVIAGASLEEMSPLAGQYLGAVPERLLPVKVRVQGPFIFANVDPVMDETAAVPCIEWPQGRLLRGGGWREHRSNWKLAGASLVDAADSHPRDMAGSRVNAEWHFPSLVVIRLPRASAAIILQPTAMDQTLWRISYFSPGDSAEDKAAMAMLTAIIDTAAKKAMILQTDVECSADGDKIEGVRAGWNFNQQLIERIARHHPAYWNAPLMDARMVY